MENHELIQLVESTLEVAPGKVTLTSNLRDLDWDSLADIGFIAEVDEKFGVTLDSLQLAASETPQDLLDLVNEALAANR